MKKCLQCNLSRLSTDMSLPGFQFTVTRKATFWFHKNLCQDLLTIGFWPQLGLHVPSSP